MKSKTPSTLFVALLALSFLCGRAADATGAFGTVQGRVQNVVTGQYLANARVAVKGTSLSALTDEFGTFRIPQVPAGAATLEVFYTGLDPVEMPVHVAAGGAVVQDVSLTNVARYGRTQSTVKLDPYVVSTARDTNAESIAINEQRFAPNLKNVVSTEAFGDVTDGNVGEFLKFIPGITTLLDDNEGGTVTFTATSISGRIPRRRPRAHRSAIPFCKTPGSSRPRGSRPAGRSECAPIGGSRPTRFWRWVSKPAPSSIRARRST